MEQQDLLLELEQDVYLDKASRGARFLDLIVDSIAMGILQRIMNTALAYFAIRSFNTAEEYAALRENIWRYLLYVYSYSYVVSGIYNIVYYTLMEGSTQGRTLGKLITGTQAVKNDGSAITWRDALLRSLCRVVPFEIFSGFGTPWHDRWTNTQVVKVQK